MAHIITDHLAVVQEEHWVTCATVHTVDGSSVVCKDLSCIPSKLQPCRRRWARSTAVCKRLNTEKSTRKCHKILKYAAKSTQNL